MLYVDTIQYRYKDLGALHSRDQTRQADIRHGAALLIAQCRWDVSDGAGEIRESTYLCIVLSIVALHLSFTLCVYRIDSGQETLWNGISLWKDDFIDFPPVWIAIWLLAHISSSNGFLIEVICEYSAADQQSHNLCCLGTRARNQPSRRHANRVACPLWSLRRPSNRVSAPV